MTFIADLHIHSKYSRATAKNLDLEHLYHAAQIKGIRLVGTGDFTHPAWMAELEEKLVETEPGLFSLRPEIAAPIDDTVPPACRGEVRFILQAEISNIYKKADRVRKNHNLIYFPNLGLAKQFNARLDAIGNIKSDGRPILGLDARDLLEIMLETSDQGFLVPAHIWTPWFSMFGSKSGFDTIEECFGDLAGHIFACETGLSSDPPMNWRVKDLDRVRLISNSDAHSPGFLGRNASVFDTAMDFSAIRSALEKNDQSAYQGTLDMYPDQGKYHYDGHRKCGVRLNPDETAEHGGICPECGKPLTLGVLYRVRELADRPEGYRPDNRHSFTYVVPLADILSEICGVGPKTKKVTGFYDKAVSHLGPELEILTRVPIDTLDASGIPLLGRAVEKMRSGDLYIDPGYDGEFGRVNLFTAEEKERAAGQKGLGLKLRAPKAPSTVAQKRGQPRTPSSRKAKPAGKAMQGQATGDENAGEPERAQRPTGLLEGLNPEQERAVKSQARAVLIQAGPGTGKTRTLTARIAWLIEEEGVSPDQVLALTFTNKAARELEERIASAVPGQMVVAATFHSFCLSFLKEYTGFDRVLMDDDLRIETLHRAMAGLAAGEKSPGKREARKADLMISLAKQQLLGPEDDLDAVAGEAAQEFSRIYRAYQDLCADSGTADFEDLILMAFQALDRDAGLLRRLRDRFAYLFVDEYQDLNLGQYELVKLLGAKAHILVIGDPDQSIYGFRGSDNRFFSRFPEDYPGCEHIRLRRNYRSTQTILDASFQMISRPGDGEDRKVYSSLNTAQKLVIRETPSEGAEAVAVGKMIEGLVGGLSLLSMDKGSNRLDGMDPSKEYSFSDFAVLYRTRKQCEAFAKAFEKAGIPFQTADREPWQNRAGIEETLALLHLAAGRPMTKARAALVQNTGAGIEIPAGTEGKESLALVREIGRLLGLDAQMASDPDLGSAWERLVSLALLYPVPGELLDRLALERDTDHLIPGAEKVSLMTMHAAKGLEFPVVFVTGCEAGLVPFARDGRNPDDPAEERRLFYVAMTRAMEILCLTYAQKRRIYGSDKTRQRSPFIDDIERDLARYEKGNLKKAPKKKEVQLELF